MKTYFILISLIFLTSSIHSDEPSDTLYNVFESQLTPTVNVLLEYYKSHRKYREKDFPLSRERFYDFRRDVVDNLVTSLDLSDWVIKNTSGKKSPINKLFSYRVLRSQYKDNIEMQSIIISIPELGLRVPAVLSLPESKLPSPGIAVFSGHSKHGLRDLVLGLNSYQRGMATRLAQAGFVTIAVEKIDSGYLSKNKREGNDEAAIGALGIMIRQPIRRWQLIANLVATEILASHPRVDETRIGATGVSLGGWLSIQTALLSNRIKAVADFGRKTIFIPPNIDAIKFNGIRDYCYVVTGSLGIGDRNMYTIAYVPRLLLTGHGKKDQDSHEQSDTHFRDILSRQYEVFDALDNYDYYMHDGGDMMPADYVIEYFQRVFTTL